MAHPDRFPYDNDTLLDELNKEKTKEYASVIAYVAIVMTFGIIGNIMTVIFYGFKTKKTTNTVLVSCLAAIDLATCVVFADEIIQICFNITFKNVGACRFMYFINHWLVGSSVLVLWIICIDRYIQVCRYFSRQFTMVSVKVTIAVVIGVSLILSIPNTVLRDIVRVKVNDSQGHTVHGYICTRSHDKGLKTTLTVFNVIDVIVIVVAIITFVVLYSLIVRTIFTSRRRTISVIETSTNPKDIDTHTSDTEDMEISNQFEAVVAIEVQNTNIKETKTVSSHGKQRKKETKSALLKKTFQIEVRITLIMIAITVGFMASFIPYFIVNIAFRPNSETVDELNVGIQLGLRSYMVNNAINPYIIGLFNPVFRQFVIKSLCRCCFSKPQNDRNNELALESCTTKGI